MEGTVVSEFDPTPEVEEAPPVGDAPETEAEDVVTDPVAELATRLGVFESTVERFKGFDPNAVNSALGRISALQSQNEALSRRIEVLSEVESRVEAGENIYRATAAALLEDPGISAESRLTLTNALNGVEQARSQREIARRMATLKEEVRAELAPAAPAVTSQNVELEATNRVLLATATKLGVDPSTVPWAALMAQAKNDIAEAATLAVDWMTEHRADPAADRVATRRVAAGDGAPSRNGVGSFMTLDQIDKMPMRDWMAKPAEERTRLIAEAERRAHAR